jgi:hypothetical protein
MPAGGEADLLLVGAAAKRVACAMPLAGCASNEAATELGSGP